MIVRVQTKNGTKRVTARPTDTLESFLEKALQELKLDPSARFSVFRSPGCKDELTDVQLSRSLQTIPVLHGDMLYLVELSTGAVRESPSAGVEDQLDRDLSTKDCKIYRKRDPQLCQHGLHGKCLNCAPLDPWDSRYLETRDPPIKHLSFHCYLRKITSGVDRGKFVNLEDLSCKIKSGCTDHAPWPAGVCTKCQPSTITLSRQDYRHVDNVMFEDSKIVERFIEYWRRSGNQRMGYLYGHYSEYSDVPLGIRAVVCAIYEPPQVRNENNQVVPKGYQVSNQCMALVRDDCLIPTLDAPELGYVRESSAQQYVPDVFYKTTNKYGNQITEVARPLPLEYLIIELTITTPLQPHPYLVGGRDPPFSVENRSDMGEIQDFQHFADYMNQQTNFLCAVSDFHLLYFLYTTPVVHLKPYLPDLCTAILKQDRGLADRWRRQEAWQTVESLITHSLVTSPTHQQAPSFATPTSSSLVAARAPPGAVGGGGGGGGAMWACQHCTLLNPPHLMECDACHLPKTH